MKLRSLKPIALFALTALSTWSCSKEEVMIDIREQAIGTYDYNMKVYEMTAAGLIHMPDADLSGSFKLIKGSEVTAIEAKEGAHTAFSGEKITKNADGFTFDLADQTGTANGSEITLVGYDGIIEDGVGYQGLYSSMNKTITVNFTFTLRDQVFLLKIVGTKG